MEPTLDQKIKQLELKMIDKRIEELLMEYEQAMKQRNQWQRRVTEIEGAVIELRKLINTENTNDTPTDNPKS